jgi:hypothetical protein
VTAVLRASNGSLGVSEVLTLVSGVSKHDRDHASSPLFLITESHCIST